MCIGYIMNRYVGRLRLKIRTRIFDSISDKTEQEFRINCPNRYPDNYV